MYFWTESTGIIYVFECKNRLFQIRHPIHHKADQTSHLPLRIRFYITIQSNKQTNTNIPTRGGEKAVRFNGGGGAAHGESGTDATALFPLIKAALLLV